MELPQCVLERGVPQVQLIHARERVATVKVLATRTLLAPTYEYSK